MKIRDGSLLFYLLLFVKSVKFTNIFCIKIYFDWWVMSLVPRKIIYLLLHLPGGVFNYLNNKWKQMQPLFWLGWVVLVPS